MPKIKNWSRMDNPTNAAEGWMHDEENRRLYVGKFGDYYKVEEYKGSKPVFQRSGINKKKRAMSIAKQRARKTA